jgi:sulfane dehydrogenase subunit SoxC
MAWKWDGSPAVLMSRAVDETGATQILRRDFIADRGDAHRYHYYAIASWSVSAAGEVRNVYV